MTDTQLVKTLEAELHKAMRCFLYEDDCQDLALRQFVERAITVSNPETPVDKFTVPTTEIMKTVSNVYGHSLAETLSYINSAKASLEVHGDFRQLHSMTSILN